jgi:hypothetical protein
MTRDRTPSYPLQDIQAAVRKGRYGITRRAAQGAASVYLDEEDIKSCVLGLREMHFFKTMPSVRRPGLAQDVSKCRYAGFAIYLKLQMSRERWAVVVSFKRDESP